MKVKFTKLAALLLGGVALLAAGCTDYEVDIQKNADAIATANEQIGALQKALDQLKADHSTDIDNLKKQISDLEALMKKDYATKAELADAVKKLENADKALQDQITDLATNKADKSWVEAQIKALVDGKIKELEDKVAAHEAALETITKTTIPAIEKQIADLQSGKVDKADYEKDKEDLAKTLNLLDLAIKDLANTKADKTELQAAVDEIKGMFKDYVTKAELGKTLEKYATKAELEAVESNLKGRIKSLEDQLEGDWGDDTVKQYIDKEIARLEERLKNAENAIVTLNEDMEAAKKALKKLQDDLFSVKSAIRSLVFVPEVYVDGVEAILVQTLNYKTQSIDEDIYNTPEEVAVEDTEDSITVSPKVIAKYHVIPSNADLNFLEEGDTVVFVRRDNDPFKTIRTRARASEDFNVIGVYRGIDEEEEDVIDIEVTVEGTPATEELISVVALQLTNEDEMYTSDYATVFSEQLDSLRIAMPAEEDYHYRRALEEVAGISELDAEAGIDTLEVYIDSLNIASCDTILIFDQKMDLLSITEAHVVAEGQEGCQVIDPAKLNLRWEFDAVEIEDWEVGAFDEITLVNTDEEKSITASIDAMDLTPVVRAYLVNEDDENAQIAYIKFYVEPQDFEVELDLGQFEFSCEGDSLDFNVSQIYEALGMSEETFYRVYPNFTMTLEEEAEEVEEPEVEAEAEEVEEEGDTVYPDEDQEENEGLYWWKGSAKWLWDNAVDADDAPGDPLTREVYFVNPNNGAKITVKLSALPAEIEAYRVPIDRYVENYWTRGWDPDFVNEDGEAEPKVADDDIEKAFALYNVFTPGSGETDPDKCIFENNINAAFLTDETGVIELGEYKFKDGTVLPAIGMPGLEVSNISYFFCKDMEKVTKIGDIPVKFEVPAGDSLSLYATVDTLERQKIAYIDNDGAGKTPNLVYLVKESAAAKLLLNTMSEVKTIETVDDEGNTVVSEYPMPGELFIYISAKGILCGDENGENGFEMNLFWPEDAEHQDVWVDHFKAKYRQPVYLSDSAADAFIDAVDFGEGGSFINIKELLNPKDWRARPFEPQKDDKFVVLPDQVDQIDYFSNYWQYYGPITVEVDTTNITCNLGPNGKEIDLPVTIIVEAPVKKADLSAEIVDTSLAYREKDGSDSGMTIAEKLESINDMVDDQTEAGFITYKNNGTNVTKDYELYIPVVLNYGWGRIEKVITVKVFRTTDSFQRK